MSVPALSTADPSRAAALFAKADEVVNGGYSSTAQGSENSTSSSQSSKTGGQGINVFNKDSLSQAQHVSPTEIPPAKQQQVANNFTKSPTFADALKFVTGKVLQAQLVPANVAMGA
jgi:hypothetical protein